ncbi:MAG: tungstate ABC transporter substrate-binding protein WtpA [Candidatus Bathyarchaeum sp.]|nr:MAG: tungstate ABC transporter substrate-binding protein WtpA [Candidatus Bathyarchaeum sp.]
MKDNEPTLKRIHIAVAVIAVVVLLASTYFFVVNYVFVNQPKQTLRIHCATSLQFPFASVEEDFETAYPNVDVQIEGHGTIQVIRHVTELGQNNDLLFVADYGLIPVMMYDTKIPDSDESFADYYIRFATNRLVLAYTDNSMYADEINADNWYSVLVRPEVTLGLGNPQVASIGYRAITAIQLAENYYDAPHLFHDLISANLSPPINSIANGEAYTIIVPEVQNPKGDKLKLRTSEVDLTALLDSGHLDYCLIYLSNALQYGFNYIELPDEVNMGSPQHQNVYEKVEVIYEHQRFATISLDRTGENIYYGVTIPKNAPHPDLAEKFLEFLLDGTGKHDFELAHHPVFSPSFTDNLGAVPESLKSLVVLEP